MANPAGEVRVGVDIGGTFTDIAVQLGNRTVTAKVLTTPRAPEAAVLLGIAAALAEAGVAASDVDLVIHGTTLATNALIERKGARTAFIGTEGHRDTLELGYEDRFSEYDVFIEKPAPLIPRDLRFTVPERMNARGEVLRRLKDTGLACPLYLMLSGGGLATLETAMRFPIRLVESGPAGGAILAAGVAAESGLPRVLSFDMGGTTAKICLIDDFRPQASRSFEIGRIYRFLKGSGLPVRIPVIEMVEIGAGGGSIATVDQLKRLKVGPESAGAEPGPAS